MKRRPWKVTWMLRHRWDWTRPVIRKRLRQRRRRGRPMYLRHGPLATPWGHWRLLNIEPGSGGPYSYDWYSWRRRHLPLMGRPDQFPSYGVDWEEDWAYGRRLA